MPFEIWFAFVAAAILILVIPGPTMLFVISHSLAQGSAQSRVLVTAVATGHFVCLLFSYFGFTSLKHMSPQLINILTWLCGLYLLCLGIRNVYKGVAVARTEVDVGRSTNLRLFANAFLITASNPKTLVFFIVMLPMFVNGRDASLVQFCILGTTFLILSTTVSTSYSIFASLVGRLFASQSVRLRMNIVSGAMMSAFGLLVLLPAR